MGKNVKISKAKEVRLDKKQKIIIASASFLLVATLSTLILAFSAGPINGSNVRVEFSDLTPYGIYSEIGGREIEKWQDLGTEELDNNTMQFNARVWAKVQAVFYTKTGSKEVWESAVKNTIKNPYVYVQTCESPGWPWTYSEKTPYYASYETYTFGKLSNAVKGYNGAVKVNASVIDLKATEFDKIGIKVSSDDLTSYTRKATIVSSSFQEIGQYDDFYTKDMAPITIALSGTYSTASIGLTSTDPKWTPIPALGMYPGDYNPDNTDLGQSAIVQTPTVGQDYVIENGFQIALRPGVTVMTQNLRFITSDLVLVDTYKHWFDVRFGYIPEKSVAIRDTMIQRNVGWHIKNYQISVEFLMEFDLESTMQILIDDSDAYDLQDVKLYFEDHYWNTVLGGESVSIPLKDKTNLELFWEQNWGYVVVFAGVAIIITFFVLRAKFGGLGNNGRKSVNIKMFNLEK